MKEFIKKLIARIMLESASCKIYKLINPNKEDIAEFNAYKKCIEIVNQVAEEYNNGWIPCSERLPKKSGKYLITQERYSLEDRLCKRPIAIEVDYVVFNATDNLWARASFFKVIAWQPLPAPYKEGE